MFCRQGSVVGKREAKAGGGGGGGSSSSSSRGFSNEQRVWSGLLDEARLLKYLIRVSFPPSSSSPTTTTNGPTISSCPVWEGPVGTKAKELIQGFVDRLLEVIGEGADPEKMEDIEECCKSSSNKGSSSKSGGPSVLVVSGSNPRRAVDLAVKARMNGLNPHVVATTTEALSEAARGGIYRSLVTLEESPLMTGSELIERLRREGGERWSSVYMVVVREGAMMGGGGTTSTTTTTTAALGKKSGADLAVETFADVR